MKKEDMIKNVPEDQVFYLSNGRKLKNLRDLKKAIESVPDSVYNHHVTSKKNDFSNWIYDVIKNNKLASDIKNSKTRQEAAKILNEEINHISHLAVINEAFTEDKPKKKRKKTKKSPKKTIKKEARSTLKNIKKFLYHDKEDNRKVFIRGIVHGIVIGALVTILLLFILSRYINICL